LKVVLIDLSKDHAAEEGTGAHTVGA
jgi:hypothetical protein